MPWAPKKRERPWQVVDQRRLTPAQRGYGHDWAATSQAYRRQHPLCVACLLRDRVTPSECVDHIIPIACCPALQWDPDNWVALCTSCHSYKTTKEPRFPWAPNAERVVLCGLPGTGKTTAAKERAVPYFDADERQLVIPQAIIAARNAWLIKHHHGPCSVIVASTLTASVVAGQIRGVVRHLTIVHAERPVRPTT